MSNSTPNPDYSRLSKGQLEALLRQPDLTEYERAKVEEELTKRIRDELLRSSQSRETSSSLSSSTTTQNPSGITPDKSSPPTQKATSSANGGCIVIALVIIAMLIMLFSGKHTHYGTQCVTTHGVCDYLDKRPVGSSCACTDRTTGRTDWGTIR